jgi:hypothetical protein
MKESLNIARRNHDQLKTVLIQTGYFSTLSTFVECECGIDHELDPDDWYVCAMCKRDIPYCNGCDDGFYEYCDECAFQIQLCQ